MKVKRIFTVLIILICLISCFFTCKPYESGGVEYEYEYTDVVYSADLNSVTIYLDGQVSVPRSLNTGIAKMACDYFEVTFLYNDGGSYKAARGEWRAGRMASVSGVEMNGTTGTGVDYGGVTKTPASGSGSAILFAGKSDKTLMAIGRLTGVDGFGTQAAPETTITANTKSVTFTISAITAGVKATAAGGYTDGKAPATATANSIDSSFLTNAGNTDLAPDVSRTNVILNNRVFGTNTTFAFPIFKLNPNDKIGAIYRFALSNASGNYSIGAYTNAIFISTPAFGNAIPGLPPAPPDENDAVIEKKQPRYTTYDSTGKPLGEYHNSILMLDEKTVIILTNNNVPNASFNPAVGFTFFTENTIAGTVFSLVFSIPVYALQEYESYDGGDGIGIKSRWYIRSGYGPSLYDLDDGTSGMGGAVLLGTGEVNKISTGERTIRIPGQELENGGVNGLPTRWQYTAATTTFDITGLVVQLVGVGTAPEVFIDRINYNDLTFKIGKSDVIGRHARWTSNPALAYTQPPSTTTGGDGVPGSYPYYIFPQEFYGIIEITVEYYDNERDRFYQTSFYVLVGNAAHPFQNNFNIVHLYDYTYTITGGPKPNTGALTAWNNTNDPTNATITFNNAPERFSNFLTWGASLQNRTTIFVLHHSFNMYETTYNTTLAQPANIIVIAADDDRNTNNNIAEGIIMGRATTTAPTNLGKLINSGGSSAGYTAWYFGKWPFRGTPGSFTWPYFPYEVATETNRTKEFTVNTEGAFWAAGGNPPPVLPGTLWKMLTDNDHTTAPGGGMYNVKVNGAVIRPTVIQNKVNTYPLLH